LFYVAATRARDHLVLSTGLDAEPETGEPAAAYLSSVGSCCTQNPGNPRASSPAMQLLLERFDWRSGQCLTRLPDGWTTPRVTVMLPGPPEPEGRRPRAPRRRFQEIEKAITTAAALEPRSVVRPSRQPGFVDIDPDPQTPSRTARLGRLIRATLADRGLLQGEPLVDVCARVAARQVPAANTAIQKEAMLCLEGWLDSPLFHELRDVRGRRAIERNVRWMLPWPRDRAATAVIRGRFDLIFPDRKGFWRPVIVSTHPAESEADHLRLLLAGPAADRIGKGPGGPAWWVQAGPGREILVEARLAATPTAIDGALLRWINRHDQPVSGS
jgi:hypothetical protein